MAKEMAAIGASVLVEAIESTSGFGTWRAADAVCAAWCEAIGGTEFGFRKAVKYALANRMIEVSEGEPTCQDHDVMQPWQIGGVNVGMLRARQ